MEIVLTAVRRTSDSILDTDFAKMQSIVVADPDQPTLLLVVINMAALTTKHQEIIELIPVPMYEGSYTYEPKLEYNSIILDQEKRTYSILTPHEEQSCLTDRCYVSDVERQITDGSCGAPQYYDLGVNNCKKQESNVKHGIYLNSALPDGVIFAFKDEVSTQTLCREREGNQVGPQGKLQKTGILQVPNGCTLTVTDHEGRMTRVKGLPISQSIQASALDLDVTGFLGVHYMDAFTKFDKWDSPEGKVGSSVVKVFQKMEEVDAQVVSNKTYIWSMLGVFILLSTIVSVALAVAYRLSTRFQKRVRKTKDTAVEALQVVKDFQKEWQDKLVAAITRDAPPPTPPSPMKLVKEHTLDRIRNRQKLSDQKEKETEMRYVTSPSAYASLGDIHKPEEDDGSYRGFRPLAPDEGLVTGRMYPRMTPLVNSLRDCEEDDELRKESAELKNLLKNNGRK